MNAQEEICDASEFTASERHEGAKDVAAWLAKWFERGLLNGYEANSTLQPTDVSDLAMDAYNRGCQFGKGLRNADHSSERLGGR